MQHLKNGLFLLYIVSKCVSTVVVKKNFPFYNRITKVKVLRYDEV